MQNKFFTAEKISSYVTRITGLGGENAYLIEGSDRALLFDGLSGVGSLKSFVRELTELPVFLVLSHGHPDHEGAAFEYGQCFIHPDDIGLMYSEFASSVQSRLGYVSAPSPMAPPKRTALSVEDVIPPAPVKTYPVYNGDIFDLGGVTLEVVAVPGHTRGTIMLLDRAARTVYSGDAINLNTLLGLYGSTTVEEYHESLLHLKTLQKDFDLLFGGHGNEPVPASIVDDAIMLCEKIMARTDDAVEDISLSGEPCLIAAKRRPDYMPEYGGYSNIVYTKDKIFGKKGPAILQGKPYID